jgi:hypothetical protein
LIRTLVSTGQTLDAQKIILRELTREFGGSAAAAGKTLPGQLNILKQNVLNLGGAIAKVLNPALTGLATSTNKWVIAAQQPGSTANQQVSGLERLGKAAVSVGKNFQISGFNVKTWADILGFELGVVGKKFGDTTPKVEKFTSALDALTASATKTTQKPLVDLRTAGGIVIPPGVRPIDITGPSAAQRSTWFDQLIGRQQLRASLLSGVAAQTAAYQKVSAELTRQIGIVGDVTHKNRLIDELLQNNATIAGLQAQKAATIKAAQDAAAQRRRDAVAAAKQEHEDWLDFAYEKAQTTKTIRDDVKTAQAALAYWKHEAATGKYTVDEARKVLYWNEQLKSLRKQGGTSDPLAGLMQVSSARLASILAAGTGLGARGRAILGANIAGAEIQPLHVHVNIDGREVGRAVTNDQARTSRRTASQTSGRRG